MNQAMGYFLIVALAIAGTASGRTQDPIRPLDGGELAETQPGELAWSDRDYQMTEWPEELTGKLFLRSSIQHTRFEAVSPGYIWVLTPVSGEISQVGPVMEAGFERVDLEVFTPYTIRDEERGNVCNTMQRAVEPADIIEFGWYGIALWSDTALPITEEVAVEPLITIPTIDMSGETERHTIVGVGTEEIYHGHVDTVLMPDGKTIFCAWAIGHARHIGPLAKSDDGGKTWSGMIRVPDNWWDMANTPTIHRLVGPEGTERLIVFADGLDWRREGKPPYPMHQAVSEDGGENWTTMAPNGIEGEVPPKTVLSSDDGPRHVMWTDLPGKVIQAESYDGGLTWINSQAILEVPGRWAQPSVIRSPDGSQLLMLMRENNREMNSLYSVSDDDGETWSKAQELPAALTGDRHVARYAPDGRLVVAMRDQAGQGQHWQSPTRGHYVAWVGTYNDIIEGNEGQYRIKLLHSHAGGDCGYSGLEVLPDGTFVATTYIKYEPGPKKHSVVSTRFTLDEVDRKLEAQSKPKRQQASIEFRFVGESDTFKPGVKLFTDRPYTLSGCPEWLEGKRFLRNSIEQTNFPVTHDGKLTVLTPQSDEAGSSQCDALEQQGFERVKPDRPPFQLFGEAEWDQVVIYQKQVQADEHYRFGKWTVVLGFAEAKEVEPMEWGKNTGERLYNGIVLPEEWPPMTIDTTDWSPMPVPYLDHPPSVVPIDVGRQLFVDDFLIEQTDLERIFHMPTKYEGNPILKPETELETIGPPDHEKPYGHGNAGAVPKSGGVWWDPDNQHFKMWYETSWFGPIALATSTDGLHWERPEFDIRPGTNQVSPDGITPDSWTVAPNWDGDDPETQWTLYIQPPGMPQTGLSLASPDGIHWNRRTTTGVTGDRSTHFYNPFRKKWVYSLRTGFGNRGRARHYYECDDFLEGANWNEADKVVWLMADQDDPPDPVIGRTPQLYNFDAVAYESIMLGFFQIHHGPENPECMEQGLPKITELNFAYSRDGFHWHRPDRRSHIPAERRDVWDRGYVQSVGGICAIVGDTLYIYYIGFRGNPDKAGTPNGMYDHSATGVAFLRRDGFASMDSGNESGTLTTRPITFSGSHLFVNADVAEGGLRVEIQDLDGTPIAPFTLDNSIPFTGDSTLAELRWKDNADLSAITDQPVRFHFELTNGSLYAFWVSQDYAGRSDGYVAGGGPGYPGPIDTVGQDAIRSE